MPEETGPKGVFNSPTWAAALLAGASLLGSVLAHLVGQTFEAGHKDQILEQLQAMSHRAEQRFDDYAQHQIVRDQQILERFGNIEVRIGVLEDRSAGRR